MIVNCKKTATSSILVLLSILGRSTAFSTTHNSFRIKSSTSSIENNIRSTLNNNRNGKLYAQQTEEGTSKKPFFVKAVEEENEPSKNLNQSSSGSRGQSQEIMDEASNALNAVGWSAPMMEEELTSNDPFVQRINAQIQSESGVDLDELLNPAKVSTFPFQ